MLPPSWKAEIEEAIEKGANATREGYKAENEKSAADIAAQIKALGDSYDAERNKPEKRDKVKTALDVATVILVFATALFTALAWWVFKGQLREMKKAYDPIEKSAKAAKDSVEVTRAAMETKRPWVGFIEDSFSVRNPLAFADDGAYLTIRIHKVKNGGDAPARGVNVTFHKMIIGPLPTTADEIRAVQGTACETAEVAKKYEDGELILPGQEIPLADMDFFVPKSGLNGNTTWITGCIGYMDTFKNPRATSFTYSVDGLKIERISGISSGAY